MPLPLIPLQILWVNLLADGLLALGLERGTPGARNHAAIAPTPHGEYFLAGCWLGALSGWGAVAGVGFVGHRLPLLVYGAGHLANHGCLPPWPYPASAWRKPCVQNGIPCFKLGYCPTGPC